MIWQISLLLIYTGVMVSAAILLRGVPGILQVIILLSIVGSSGLFGMATAMDLAQASRENANILRLLGHEVEHLVIMLYIFRLFVVDQERRCLPNSSRPYPSWPG